MIASPNDYYSHSPGRSYFPLYDMNPGYKPCVKNVRSRNLLLINQCIIWKRTSSTRPKKVYTIPSTDSHRYFNIANTSDIGPLSKKTTKVVNDCKGTRLRPSQMLQEHFCTSKSAFWSAKKKHEEELPSDKVRTSKQDRPQQIIMPQWERRRPNLEGNWNQTWEGVSRLRMKSSWLY